jgi:phage terminase small subunit
MPLKNGKATPQERVFVEAYVANGDARVAAKAAGYRNPETSGYGVIARPAIAAEVARLQLERLQNEILPLAVDVHKELLTAKGVPAGARVQAVKLAYDYVFGDNDKHEGKELHEMSAEQLQTQLDKLRRQQARIIAAEAVVTDVEQVPGAGVFD